MTTSYQTIPTNKSVQWLFYCLMAYFVMNGAQLWETAIMVPAWTAAPPASLHFFQGPTGLDFKVFWVLVHSLHEVLFMGALVTCWRNPTARNPLLLLFLAHFAVRVWTLAYFAPTIIWFQSLPPSEKVDPVLVEKAALWRNLNYLRVFLFFIINFLMLVLYQWQSRKYWNHKFLSKVHSIN